MIRDIEDRDFPVLLNLAREMHAESRFAARYPFDPGKVESLLRLGMRSDDWAAWVIEDDGMICGAFLGMVTEQWFSRALVAQDLALFVRPEHRGRMAGMRLVERFKLWARTRGAVDVEVGVNTGVATERTGYLLRACGFRPVGALYSLETEECASRQLR